MASKCHSPLKKNKKIKNKKAGFLGEVAGVEKLQNNPGILCQKVEKGWKKWLRHVKRTAKSAWRGPTDQSWVVWASK